MDAIAPKVWMAVLYASCAGLMLAIVLAAAVAEALSGDFPRLLGRLPLAALMTWALVLFVAHARKLGRRKARQAPIAVVDQPDDRTAPNTKSII